MKKQKNKRKPCPILLYKYFGANGLNALTSLTFRFTKPNDLNDPFEGRAPSVFQKTSSNYPALSVPSGTKNEVLGSVQEHIIELICFKYGITCFSEAPNSHLMWAHYGQSHSGFVVGINSKHPSCEKLGHLMPVHYSKTRPKITYGDDFSFLQSLSTKSVDWKYEKEWRFISKSSTYVPCNHYFLKPIDPSIIEMIFFGANASKELVGNIKKWADDYSHIKLLHYRLDSFKFDLFPDNNIFNKPFLVSSEKKKIGEADVILTSDCGNFGVGSIEWQNGVAVGRDMTDIVMGNLSEQISNSEKNVFGEIGVIQNALREFEEVIRLRPKSSFLWMNLGCVFDRLEHYQDSLTAYKEAIRLKPDNHEAWYGKGVVLGHLKLLENALEAHEEAIRLKPDYFDALFVKVHILVEFGRFQDALQAIKEAISIKPADSMTWYVKGEILRNLKKYQNAIEACDKSLVLNPSCADAIELREILFSMDKEEG